MNSELWSPSLHHVLVSYQRFLYRSAVFFFQKQKNKSVISKHVDLSCLSVKPSAQTYWSRGLAWPQKAVHLSYIQGVVGSIPHIFYVIRLEKYKYRNQRYLWIYGSLVVRHPDVFFFKWQSLLEFGVVERDRLVFEIFSKHLRKRSAKIKDYQEYVNNVCSWLKTRTRTVPST